MRLLSIDPGIRNLAVCRLVDGAITHWEVIDLVPNKTYCACGGVCVALWRGDRLCDACLAAAGATLCPVQLKRLKKEGLAGWARKWKLSEEGTKPALLARLTEEAAKRYAIKAVAGNANVERLDSIAVELAAAWAARPWMADVDAVVVEQQMKSRMIAVELAAMTLAAAAGVRVAVQKAVCKLNLAEIPVAKRTYAKRKRAAVEFCAAILGGRGTWVDFLHKHSKKDDLADSFLHAVYYWRTHGATAAA